MSEKAPQATESEQLTGPQVLEAFAEKRDSLNANLTEIQARPGFKLTASEMVARRFEERAAREELDVLETAYNELGGRDIDKAQLVVDALNFKSDASDHVHAKGMLSEAKARFYENFLDTQTIKEGAINVEAELPATMAVEVEETTEEQALPYEEIGRSPKGKKENKQKRETKSKKHSSGKGKNEKGANRPEVEPDQLKFEVGDDVKGWKKFYEDAEAWMLLAKDRSELQARYEAVLAARGDTRFSKDHNKYDSTEKFHRAYEAERNMYLALEQDSRNRDRVAEAMAAAAEALKRPNGDEHFDSKARADLYDWYMELKAGAKTPEEIAKLDAEYMARSAAVSGITKALAARSAEEGPKNSTKSKGSKKSGKEKKGKNVVGDPDDQEQQRLRDEKVERLAAQVELDIKNAFRAIGSPATEETANNAANPIIEQFHTKAKKLYPEGVYERGAYDSRFEEAIREAVEEATGLSDEERLTAQAVKKKDAAIAAIDKAIRDKGDELTAELAEAMIESGIASFKDEVDLLYPGEPNKYKTWETDIGEAVAAILKDVNFEVWVEMHVETEVQSIIEKLQKDVQLHPENQEALYGRAEADLDSYINRLNDNYGPDDFGIQREKLSMVIYDLRDKYKPPKSKDELLAEINQGVESRLEAIRGSALGNEMMPAVRKQKRQKLDQIKQWWKHEIDSLGLPDEEYAREKEAFDKKTRDLYKAEELFEPGEKQKIAKRIADDLIEEMMVELNAEKNNEEHNLIKDKIITEYGDRLVQEFDVKDEDKSIPGLPYYVGRKMIEDAFDAWKKERSKARQILRSIRKIGEAAVVPNKNIPEEERQAAELRKNKQNGNSQRVVAAAAQTSDSSRGGLVLENAEKDRRTTSRAKRIGQTVAGAVSSTNDSLYKWRQRRSLSKTLKNGKL